MKNGNDIRKTVARFVGILSKRGKREKAEYIFDDVLEALRIKTGRNPVLVILEALDKIKPAVALIRKKKGSTIYKLPIPLVEEKGYAIAVRWIIDNARKRTESTITERLISELLATLQGKNTTLMKRRDDIHKTASSNMPFLRFR